MLTVPVNGKERAMRRHFIAFFATLVVLCAWSATAEEDRARLIGDGVVVSDHGGEVTLKIHLSRPVGWRLWMAGGPPRLVIELAGADWTETAQLRSTSVQELEVKQTAPQTSELHAILREPLGIRSAEMIAAEDGSADLVVVLQATTADAFRAELDQDDPIAAPPDQRVVVAIDPGHGGRDPGAEVGEIREADLVLEFGMRLRDSLLASGQFDVVMTRSDDSFLSLDARLMRARAAGADLFLSLHADALRDADAASGLVLYRLAPGAHASANLRLRERHSPDDQLTGLDLSGAGENVTMALLELARRQTVPRTRAMSSALLTAIEGADLVVNSRPERTENFAVLKAADIPSLLIELGFLSTEADLKRLTSDDWQTEAANSIRDGLILWAGEDRLR
ncbi:MAG: N-acetylmuramoyl-L-alanine amidase [Pseudomonadota bacterium]